MPEIERYAPGTPSWVDLGSPDLEASQRFYGELFGWETQVNPDPEAGGYALFQLDGRNVAGLGPAQPGVPPFWASYVSVDDVDATTTAVKDAGGSVMAGPMTVLDAGRMAIYTDPTGAPISVWQPLAHKGADIVNEPNSFCWNELQSRDLESAKAFYEAVFGWKLTKFEGPMDYTNVELGGNSIAGMMPMPEMIPPEVPSHWTVYFRVADCAATVERARTLGATVMVAPVEIPPGTNAVLQDPQGASFNVLEFREG